MAAASTRDDTFPKLLIRNAQTRGARPAVRHKDLGIWQTWTWAEVHDLCRAYAAALHALGLQKGETIAIVGSNRPRLYWSMMAAQMLGAIPVPVYADSVADEMAYVLAHADVKLAAVEDQEQVDKLLSIADRLPNLRHVLYDEDRGLRDYDHTRLHGIEAMLRKGAELLRTDAAAALDAAIAFGKGEDLGVILYTSGTTGRPKGVMLSYDNVLISARNGCLFDKLDETEETIAYLPLAWVGDHIFSYAQSLVAGFCVNCPESPDTVVEDRREIGTTYAFAPPRVYENLLTLTMVRMEDAAPFKRRLFHYFLDVAKRVGEPILNGEAVSAKDRLLYGLGEMLVYGPLKNRFGFSRIKVAYTAGEAIGPEIFRFFRSLGINLKQLYGQTEAAVYVTMQPDAEIRADTVGRPAPDVEVRIADNGEVMFRSPGVFLAYYKDPEATAKTKTPDGWVHSGDAGFFDATGHLKIIDRAKDVGKMRDGSLFPPKYIENKLKFYSNIKEVVAFGDGQDYVACFINIDLTAVGNWAERNNIVYASYQELAGHPQVYDMIARHVDEVNRSLAVEPMMGGAQVRRFLILHKELDADDGELTRTQKVRRGFIAERYAPLVTALYDGSPEADIRTEVTFEDGRKGVIAARVKIRDCAAHPVAAPTPVMEHAA
ncbi:long-chain-fatty-acid--CoA ligase [Alsobacter metallidurans]|uniref:Long-chain-fatty-acid--CoA ligase n=1 Tax=Alsobacter metallidurans TaxID=340221 RepID=A0A917IB23_9HYPH|nr:AMP-binding protein [Alsobacter metallidurans]GGH30561.1 long-chain-fatty-acid--CoA ligase [Alsobacter metallidurans]